MGWLALVLALIAAILLALVAYGGVMAARSRMIARGAELAAPKGGHTVEVLGESIHYIEQGQGRPILLVHGLGGHHHHMRPIVEALSGEYRLVSIDRPGSGYSSRARMLEALVFAQAQQVAAIIEALGLEKPLLVGHSLGGAIALATALNHPDKISGLALIAPLTHHRETVPPEFRALYIRTPWLRRLISETFALPIAVRNAPQTLSYVFGPQRPPADYATKWGAMLGLRPAHFYAASTDFVAIAEDMPNLPNRYGELKMPVGMIFGDADRVLSVETHGRSMKAKVGHLDYRELPGIGHMPQFVATAEVAAFVRHMAGKAFGTA